MRPKMARGLPPAAGLNLPIEPFPRVDSGYDTVGTYMLSAGEVGDG